MHQLYVPPKYRTFKDEILSWFDQKKKQQHVSLDNLTSIITKAAEYERSRKARKFAAICPKHLHYGIEKGTPLSIQNLISVILYCDYTDLCTDFSSTFRPIRHNEPLESIKRRNREFWWMSKLLRETVCCWSSFLCIALNPCYGHIIKPVSKIHTHQRSSCSATTGQRRRALFIRE